MNLRLFSCWLAGLVAPILLFVSCATAENPIPETRPETRIVAIGDLHGDYDAYESLLTEAELIDNRGRWVGGKTILIQMGDVPDRGPDSLKIILHLQKLQRQAARKHGRVIALIGNHEAMNMTGDLRYVHPGEYQTFVTRNSKLLRERTYESNREVIDAFYLAQNAALSSVEIKTKWFEDTPLGKIEHQSAWAPTGKIGKWVMQNPAVAIVGDSLYVHGGVSEKYASYSVDDINQMAAAALAERSTYPMNIINDELGPLWYRGNVRPLTISEPPVVSNLETTGEPIMAAVTDTPLSQEEEIDLVLRTFGVARIIVAHTPALQGIKASSGGKLIQIDTGIADYYGGTQSFLEIRNGVLYAHDNGVVTITHDENVEEGAQ
ncbi:MAG: protein-tyrosine-phosphatase [Alphaproteobacteria bacterium]|nr:protein-tyrosine-phosphatase [Alphaproteobacteria bacterium]